MAAKKFAKFIDDIRTSKKQSRKSKDPVALHSMLLALEPRLVFDASLPAAAEAVDNHDPQAAGQTDALASQTHSHAMAEASKDSPAAPELDSHDNLIAQTDTRDGFHNLLRGFGDISLMGTSSWSEASEVKFTGTFTMNEDGTYTFGARGLELIDPDSADFKITLSVEHGRLDLSYVAGLVDNQYVWSADHRSVSFAGDKTVVQLALDSLKYTPDADWNGTDTLTVLVSDEANDNQEFTQALTVTPVPDKPDFLDKDTLPPAGQVDEDAPTVLKLNHGTLEAPVWKPLGIADPDGTGDIYDLTLTVKNGTLTGTWDSAITSGDTTTYTLANKSLGEVNGILAGLEFTGAKDFYGKAELRVDVLDRACPLNDNTLSKTFEVNVLPVNDTPTLDPAGQAETGKQLHIAEVGADGKTAAEGVFDLSHFNKAWTNAMLPDGDGNLALFDVDNNLHQLVVKVESTPLGGTLWRKIGGDWVKLGAGSTFSLWDVYKGNVKYSHDPAKQVRDARYAGSEHDSFAYSIQDGAGGEASGTVHVALTPVNQEPTVEVKKIPGLIERLDGTWVTDALGNQVINYTIWAYEGEQGVPFAFTVTDPDQALGADFTVRFSQLPDPNYGCFWYSGDNGATYQKVTTSTAISLEAMQAGYLRFSHSGRESATGNFTFKVEVTDDGGGEGPAGKNTVEVTLGMNIRPNNDHPEWAGAVAGKWSDLEESLSVDGGRTITIDNTTLNATDRDSSNQNITYTVSYDNTVGRLLYSLGGGNYRLINSGEKVSQTDVNSGKVLWWFQGDADVQTDLTFTVRDGSITATPVPSDAEQEAAPGGLAWPYAGPSASGWEHGSGAHEGGIGAWVDQGDGSHKWTPTVFTLHLSAVNIPSGGGTPSQTFVDPDPHFESPSNHTATLDEGNRTRITAGMLHAWFVNRTTGLVIDPADSNGDPSKLVYRIQDTPDDGWIMRSTDGVSFTHLGLYGSFTQKDVDSGYIYYQHNSSENFSDTFAFSVSDGRTEVKSSPTSTTFYFNLDMTPVNDTPETHEGVDVQVKEHDTPNADRLTPGGTVKITTQNIAVSDVDGSGDKTGLATYSTKNALYIVITELPEHGKLYYDGVEITKALSGADLASARNSGGYKDWADNSPAYMNGIIIIKVTDLAGAASKLSYRHDGTENFYDGFKYIVTDNMGIVRGDPAHDGGSVNGREQTVNVVVTPVNDIPERAHADTKLTVDEEGSGTLNSGHISFADPDGTPAAIQFIITELPKWGELSLNGKVLGVNGVFTQEDVNNGRIQYKHDGSEHHSDSFKYKVSDSIHTSTDSIFSIAINPINDAPTLSVRDTVYVESIAGGIIINDIRITDPDYGDNNKYDGAADTGVVHNVVTVDLALSTTTPGLDLSKVFLYFWNGNAFSPDNTGIATRTAASYRLTGTLEQIQTWLHQVKIQSDPTGGQAGTAYDPNGDIKVTVTVHDGKPDGLGGWTNPNGGQDLTDQVYDVSKPITVYISPVNDAPAIDAASPATLTVGEDSGAVAVKNDGNPIKITDSDAFDRGGNKIVLTAEHGNLYYTALAGPTITGQGTKTVTITGTLKQINDVLATLTYKPGADYNGPESIVYKYYDNANSGDLPNNVSNTNQDLYGQAFKYNTSRKDDTNNDIWGLGVSGKIAMTVTPVNDAPAITAPTEIFIRSPLLFSGLDALDNPVAISLYDLDLHPDKSGTGSAKVDQLTLTLEIQGAGNGWLKLTDAQIAAVGASKGACLNDGDPAHYTTLVLTGTEAGLNTLLGQLQYDRANWDATNPVTIKITASDKLSADGKSNGAPDTVNSLKEATHLLIINCSNKNDAPSVAMPPLGWNISEDDGAAKIFASNPALIVLNDPDTFGGQIYVKISVDVGELGVTQAELTAAGFKFGGDPALRDAFKISDDKKTVYFKAPLDILNAALKQITYKAPAEYNGQAQVTVYAHDLGLWGDKPAGTVPVPGDNPFNLSDTQPHKDQYEGLAVTQTGNISITAINDAPTNVRNSAYFWGGANDANNKAQGDFEDTAANAWTGKTVQELFDGLLGDTADSQKDTTYNPNNPAGSDSNVLAGVVIVGNAANAATQGVWQYSTDNGANWNTISTTTSLSNGIYLDKTALIRFQALGNFNGTPGNLTVRLADDSAADAAHGNPAAPLNGATGVDLSGVNTGGNTRYSAANMTLATFVRAVNDAPVASGNAALAAVNEDSANPAGNTVTNLFGGNFSDATDNRTGFGGSSANGLGGVVIIGNTADAATQGKWQYFDGTWKDIPTDFSGIKGLYLTAATKIRFLPEGDFNGAPGKLTAYLADNSAADAAHGNAAAPALGAYVDLSNASDRGGTTRYSTATVDLAASVTAVNDAPLVTGGDLTKTLPSIIEDAATAGNSGALVSTLFGGNFDDSRDAVTGGSTSNAFEGVLLTGNTSTSAQGYWQYNDNSGGGWKNIPTGLSNTNGFALKASWSVRFSPATDWKGEPGQLTARLIDSSAAATGNPAADYSGAAYAISGLGGVTRYSTGTMTLGISVTSVNDAPAIVSGKTTVTRNHTEDTTTNTTVDTLFGPSFSDAADARGTPDDSSAFAGIIIISNAATAAQGVWEYSTDGLTWTAVGTRGATDGLYLSKDTQLRFTPEADYNGTLGTLQARLVEAGASYATGDAGLDVSGVNSGGATHVSAGAVTIDGSISAVNDAPVATGDTALPAVNEDSPNPAGDTVGNLFGGNFNDGLDNSNGSTANGLGGVVVVGNTANAATQGKWQYFDGTWKDIPASLNASSGLYLTVATNIRFLPNGDYNGTPGKLTVYLADDNSSTAAPALGATVNLSNASSRGGITRYSTASVDLTTSVTPVNDAPAASGAATLAPVHEDSADPAGNTVGGLFGGNFNDNKDNSDASAANSLAGVVIASNTADAATQGKWQYFDGTWKDIPTDFSAIKGLYLDAAAKIRFLAAGDFNGTPGKLTVYLADDNTFTAVPATGANVDLSNASSRGGTTRYSSASVELATSIAAVNDAPGIKNGNTAALGGITEDPAANNGGLVSAIFGSHFDDSTDSVTSAVSGGSSPNNLEGVLITGNTAAAAEGAWQYNDGSGWKDIPDVAVGQGFAIKADWSVRFSPAQDWKGAPGQLTVRLIDSSPTVAGNPAASYGGATAHNISGFGGVTRYSSDTMTLGISVSGVNDAPTIVAGKDTVTQNHTEDSLTTTTVNALFGNSLSDAADARGTPDDSSAFAGVIITGNAAAPAQGVWEYSTDGLNWQAVGTRTTADGLYLAANTQLRFTPAADYNGTLGTLQARLVEAGASYATGTANIDVSGTNSGGATHISADAVSITGTIAKVNDAPVALNPGTAIDYAVDEDGLPAGDTAGSLFGGRFSDSADARYNTGSNPAGSTADSLAGIIVKSAASDPAKGVWQYSNDGVNWNSLTAGMFVRATDKIRFLPAPDYNGAPGELQAHLVENSGAYSGALPASGSDASASLGATGGTTPISAGFLTLKPTVRAVNDAPTALNPNTPIDYVVAEDSRPAGDSVAALFGGRFSDARDDKHDASANPSGSLAAGLAGIIVESAAGDPVKGVWQYSNDGVNWNSLTAGMFIRATDKIRFLPARDWNGAPGELKAHLVENTGAFASPPASGSQASLAGVGGATPVSARALTLKATVTPVNDAPLWDGSKFSPVGPASGDKYIYQGPMLVDRDNPSSPGNRLSTTIDAAIRGAFLDSADAVPDGSSADGFKGVWAVGILGPGQLGKWQYYDGMAWRDISGLSESNAVFIKAGTQIRFAYDASYQIPVGVMPHSALKVALADSSDTTARNTGERGDVSRRGGATAVSEQIVGLMVAVLPRNYLPEFSGGPAAPVRITEGDGPVVLAPNIGVSDTNLDHAQNTDRWKGASVTIQREGGPNGADRFGSSGALGGLTQGGKLVYNGVTLGEVSKNSGGTLKLTFNENANSRLVSEVLRLITYANSSRNPEPSVALIWTVDDGNYQQNGFYPQGLNPRGKDSGTGTLRQVVDITLVDDPPMPTDDARAIGTEARAPIAGNVLSNDFDHEGPLTVISSGAAQAKYGALTINADGGYSYTVNRAHPLLAAMKAGETALEEISYTVRDSGGFTATAVLRITIVKEAPPVVIIEDGKDKDKGQRDEMPGAPPPVLPPPAPLPGSGLDLTTDKPVVREVESVRRALESSLDSNVAGLGQTLSNLYTGHERPVITLTGRMDDQVVYAGYLQTVSLPKDLFRHSRDEELFFEAATSDGSPLPEGIIWNGRTCTFNCNVKVAVDKPVDLIITARDRHNNTAKAVFRLNVVDPSAVQPGAGRPETEPRDNRLPDGPDQPEGAQVLNKADGAASRPLLAEPVNADAAETDEAAAGAMPLDELIARSGQQAMFHKALECLNRLCG